MPSPKSLLLATLALPSTASNLRIVYRQSIPHNLHGIAAFNTENASRTLVSVNCSNILTNGPFATEPISINLRLDPLRPENDPETTPRHPSGNITIGDVSYSLEGHDHDGKPSCGVAWTFDWVDVYCQLYSTTIPAAERLDASTAEKCFGDDFASVELLRGDSQADTSMARPASEWNQGGELIKPFSGGSWFAVLGLVLILGAVAYFIRIGRER